MYSIRSELKCGMLTLNSCGKNADAGPFMDTTNPVDENCNAFIFDKEEGICRQGWFDHKYKYNIAHYAIMK